MADGKTAKTSTNRRRSPGEGSVYFDSTKDRWVAAAVINGKRRKRFGATKTEALKNLKALTAVDAKAGDGNLTVATVIDNWLTRGLPARRVKGQPLASNTIDLHRWYAALWKAELGTKRVDKLRVQDVENALDRLAKADPDNGRKSLGVSSLKHARATLSFALDHSIRRGDAVRNVARIAVLTPTARQSTERRSMTLEQAKKFIEAAKGNRLEALFLIMLTVGLRPGEVAGLTWEAIDLSAGRLTVMRARRRVDGRYVLANKLKTRRSARTLDLPPIAFEALRLHRITQNRERDAATSWADETLVFSSAAGELLTPEHVRWELARVGGLAGIGEWSPNELRHTAASILSDDGIPLERIADLFGHTDSRMLEEVYRHQIRDSVSTAAEPMERIFRAEPAPTADVPRRRVLGVQHRRAR